MNPRSRDFDLGFLGGLIFGLYMGYRHYERQVGVENASIRGWHIWMVQQKALRRRQPRHSVAAGCAMVACTFILTSVGGHTTLYWLYWVAILTAVCSVVFFSHEQPPPWEVQAINAEHQTGRYVR